jgi:molybdenum cofactor cytidylyltransferase
MNRHELVGVLLAAGRSARFGADKLLHPLADGTPMAVRCARTLVSALPRSVAVVRTGQDRLQEMLRAEGLEIAVCAGAHEGMGASLAWGVAATAGAGGWIVALADMPCIQAATLEHLVAAMMDGASIALPVFQGRRGHPVGFGRTYRERLQACSGDRGARGILDENSARIVQLACDDPGVVWDVDRPEDLAALRPAGTPHTAL